MRHVRCKKNETTIKVVRVCDIATLTTLAHYFSLAVVASLRYATIVSVLLTAFALPASLAFSPAPTRRLFGVSVAIPKDNCLDFGDVYSSRHDTSSSCLYASDDGTVNGKSESKLHGDDDDEEDEEVDIITQRLRRNADNGPINPIKEHNKMMRENEDEAKNVGIGENNNITGADAQSALYSYMTANAVDPDFDPDVSTDEAYVESQLEELLSRKGEALSRLGPGIATLPLDPSSDEAKSELDLSKKELELQQVIDEVKSSSEKEWDESNLEESCNKQSDILEKAHKLQAEIDQSHVDDCGAVLIANLGFYEAFSLQDPEGMRNVWWQSPSVICIHPSHPPLIGSNAVFESFAAMFDNGIKGRVRCGGDNSAASGGVFMTPANIRGLSVRGTTASLVCDEEVYSKGSAGENSLLVNKLVATNVFRKIGGQWKMVHRHASWHPETTAAREAMKVEPGVVLYDDEKDKARSDATNRNQSKRSKGMTLRRLNGDGMSKRPLGLPSVPSSLEGLDANAVLGIPMPKEEETKKSKASDGVDGTIGKIINLSDLLGGNDSGGDKDDNDKGIGDALADMLMGSADSDSTQTTGSGTPEDPFIARRIIKIGPEGIENLAGKKSKKDIDDEEDQDVVIDLRDKSEEERKEVLSQLGVPSSVTDEVMKASAMDASVAQAPPPNDKEMIRQKCIATLRKLSGEGLLSSKQKRVLLTDIITSSAKGETSMVEVAFELLCENDSTDDSELDTGMEDFTEQCRVFASMGEDQY